MSWSGWVRSTGPPTRLAAHAPRCLPLGRLQIQREERGAGHRIVPVRRDRAGSPARDRAPAPAPSSRACPAACGGTPRLAPRRIAASASRRPRPGARSVGPDVEPLHLADAGLERPDRDAPGRRPVVPRDQQPARRAAHRRRADRPAPPRTPESRGRRRATVRVLREQARATSRAQSPGARRLDRDVTRASAPSREARRISHRAWPPAGARRRPRSVAPAARCRRCRRASRPAPIRAALGRRRRAARSSSAAGALDARSRRASPRSGRAAARPPRPSVLTAECAPGSRADVDPAGGGHQVGHPVAGQIQRLEPLDAEHPRGAAWARCGGAARAGSGDRR